jgi:hypothetical protein
MKSQMRDFNNLYKRAKVIIFIAGVVLKFSQLKISKLN